MDYKDHQVLIYAGASTSAEADRKFRRQAAACLSFSRNKVELSATVDENRGSSSILTTKSDDSDRSDLVLDSQRHVFSRDGGPELSSKTFLQDFPATKRNNTTGDILGNPSNMPSIRDVYDTSRLQFIAHESTPYSQPIDTEVQPTLTRRSLGVLFSQPDHLDLADFTEYVPTGPIATVSDVVPSNAKTVRQACQITKVEAKSSLMTSADADARQALRTREEQALMARKSRFSGLSAKNPLLDNSSRSQRQHLSHSSSLRSTANLAPLVAAKSVDTQLVLTTASNHGASRTPSSEYRSSQPSFHLQSHSIENDVSSTSAASLLIPQKRRFLSNDLPDAAEITTVAFDESVIETNSTYGPFTNAQIASPFYHPTRITSSANQSTVKAHSYGKYSDTSLAHILGTSEEHIGFNDSLDFSSHISSTPNIQQKVSLTQNSVRYRIEVSPSVVNKELNGTCTVIEQGQPLTVLQDSSGVVETLPSHKLRSSAKSNDRSEAEFTTRFQQVIESGASDVKLPAGIFTFCLHPVEVDSEPPLLPGFLKSLKVPLKCKKSARLVRPLERGYWRVPLHELGFVLADTLNLWNELCSVIRSRKLHWVTLQIVDQQSLRVYCHGQCVLQVWVLIYAISGRIIKSKGISWIDASGTAVLHN